MSFDVLSISEIPDELLLRIRRYGPAGVFYSRALIQSWVEVYDWKGLALTDGDSLMLGYEKRTLLGQMFFSLPFGWYGGIVGIGHSRLFVSGVLDFIHRKKYVQKNIVQFQGINEGIIQQGYKRHLLTTHILNLRSNFSISENTERNIKKARASNLTIRFLHLRDRSQFADLFQEQIKRTGEERKISEKYYHHLFSLSSTSESGVEIVGAFSESALLACHFYFNTNSDRFYFDGFSSKEGMDKCANFLIFDNMINRSIDEKIERFNFGATPTGDSGLLRFKEGWGAQPVEYCEYYHRSPTKQFVDLLTGRA